MNIFNTIFLAFNFVNFLNGQQFTSNSNDGIQARIIGGTPARPYSYPFIVSLQYNRQHYCGGTLYRSDIVITAAHCSDVDPKLVEVVSNVYNVFQPDGQQYARRVKVRSIYVHPQYNSSNYYNDIAVWKLNTSFQGQYNIYLDYYAWSYREGIMGKVIGWGSTFEKGPVSPILREAQVPIVNNSQCIKDYVKANYTINPQLTLCAGYQQGGIDSCQGDSGGPLTIDTQYGPFLLGVVSVGSGCGRKDLPGIYTRVYNYIQFINYFI